MSGNDWGLRYTSEAVGWKVHDISGNTRGTSRTRQLLLFQGKFYAYEAFYSVVQTTVIMMNFNAVVFSL